MVTTDIFYLVIHSLLSHSFQGCVFKFGIFEVGPKVPVTSFAAPHSGITGMSLLTFKKKKVHSLSELQ